MYKNLRNCALFVLPFVLSLPLTAQVQSDFYFELPEGPEKLVAPVQVDFTNAAIGENLDFDWSINGESFSIEEEPQHLFAEAGEYQICLEVQDLKGKDRICQTLEFFETVEETGVISVSK